jgi:predicted  nucleic acid-binding Zn-ribbon protein
MAETQAISKSVETQMKEWEAHLNGLREKLSNLKNRAEKLSGKTKLKYLEHLQTLEQRIEDTQGKINDGKTHTHDITAE